MERLSLKAFSKEVRQNDRFSDISFSLLNIFPIFSVYLVIRRSITRFPENF